MKNSNILHMVILQNMYDEQHTQAYSHQSLLSIQKTQILRCRKTLKYKQGKPGVCITTKSTQYKTCSTNRLFAVFLYLFWCTRVHSSSPQDRWDTFLQTTSRKSEMAPSPNFPELFPHSRDENIWRFHMETPRHTVNKNKSLSDTNFKQ